MANGILQKPPNLLRTTPDGPYDWREFDRWIREVHSMLSLRSDSNSFSLLAELEAIHTNSFTQSTATSTAPSEQEDNQTLYWGHTNPAAVTTKQVEDNDNLTLYWMGVQ